MYYYYEYVTAGKNPIFVVVLHMARQSFDGITMKESYCGWPTEPITHWLWLGESARHIVLAVLHSYADAV
mgnify:CR=1